MWGGVPAAWAGDPGSGDFLADRDRLIAGELLSGLGIESLLDRF